MFLKILTNRSWFLDRSNSVATFKLEVSYLKYEIFSGSKLLRKCCFEGVFFKVFDLARLATKFNTCCQVRSYRILGVCFSKHYFNNRILGGREWLWRFRGPKATPINAESRGIGIFFFYIHPSVCWDKCMTFLHPWLQPLSLFPFFFVH